MLPQAILPKIDPYDFELLNDLNFKPTQLDIQRGIDFIARNCDQSIYIDDKSQILPLFSDIKQSSIKNLLQKSEQKTQCSNNLRNNGINSTANTNKTELSTNKNVSKNRALRTNSLKKARSYSLLTNLNIKKREPEQQKLFGTCRLMITKDDIKQKNEGKQTGMIQFSSNKLSKRKRCSILPVTQIEQKDDGKRELLTQKKINQLQTQQKNKQRFLKFTKRNTKKSNIQNINEQSKKKLQTELIYKKISKNLQEKTFFQKKEAQIISVPTIKQLQKPTQNQSLQISKLRREHFKVLRPLGKGNFGQVQLVIHKQTGFICAMKILSKQKMVKEDYVNQIIRQIVIQSYTNHPNIVPLYGVFDDTYTVYILMEYCPEGHLLDLIIKKRRLEQEQAAQCTLGLANGIQYLQNQNIIHRDIKPENVMLTHGVTKIADFGWSVYQGKYGGMRETTSGSPLYYSPEIVQKQAYNQKIDIWAMGILCYECLIGQVPFKVYTMMNINRIVDDDLSFPQYIDLSQQSKDFIKKCLMKKPEQRWSINRLIKHPFLINLEPIQ